MRSLLSQQPQSDLCSVGHRRANITSFGNRYGAPAYSTPSTKTTSTASKPTKPKTPHDAFNVGEIVVHPIFGEGMVTLKKPMGADTLYEIAFDSCGTKKLMGTYAKLKKKQ